MMMRKIARGWRLSGVDGVGGAPGVSRVGAGFAGLCAGRLRRLPLAARVVAAVLVGGVLSGCAVVGPNFEVPQARVQADWDSGLVGVDGQARPGVQVLGPGPGDRNSFWRSFEDPVLLGLLERAHAQNLSLQASALAVEQARAVVRVGESANLPAVQLQGSSVYTEPDLASKLKGKTTGSTTNQVGLGLSWELDFWGKVARANESDLANLNASKAALAAARASLDASIASAYCNVRVQEQRLLVAQQNLTQQTENARIAQARYRLGSTSELDWQQAQAQLAQTQAQIPALQSALAQYRHALSVLVGETPDYVERTVTSTGMLPRAPGKLPLGAPSDLLRRRPDVLQAQFAAAAQSAKIGQAQAALYPSFTLSGSVGYSATDNNNLFSWDSRALSAGLGLNLPIFDRGRLKAQVQVQDAAFKQSVLAYQNQVLKAQQEVLDAVSAFEAYGRQLKDLQNADRAATRSAKLALVRFLAGQTDYTTVSSAEQVHLQSSDAVVQAQGGVLQAAISAWRAVGGDWLTADALASQPVASQP